MVKKIVVDLDPPHLREFQLFLKELNRETPRGLMLISCSMIDDLLARAISAFLIDGKAAKTLLEGFNAPLGTLAARATAAVALGVVSEREFSEIEILRKVRNEFAHAVVVSFDDPRIKDLCANLTMCAKDYDDVKVGIRGRYTTAACAVILHLTNRPHYVGEKRLRYQPWPY